ncbi:undecaprenyl/decaprenyl-phosphate alpha-N-acetylglucosaminyl 1-phosphate transferase [Flavobacteriaceae bacterium]|nr:undecaprenyl/decaprenyl-phosphate alpha-N-acetylglucosaminyl 1-phosphate transferase [Flavobacteriaceae bacterium]
MLDSNFFIFFSSLILSLTSLVLYQKIFIKNKIFDIISSRSSHKVNATRSGGSSLFTALFILSIFFYSRSNEIYDFSLFIPLSIVVFVGLYDDIYRLDFKLKFIFQIIVAKIIIDNGLIIDNLHGIFGIFELGRIAGQILTIIIVVAIINSINFIDGIDGLAISVLTVFLLSFEFFSSSSSGLFNLTLIILGSVAPLYFFNFRNKNKIFLGDSGSLLLGTIVSIYILNILSQGYTIKTEYDINKVIYVISILPYPIIDIIRIFFLRLSKNKSPFIADKNHIHHLILNNTNSHLKTTAIIVSFSLMFLFTVHLIF